MPAHRVAELEARLRALEAERDEAREREAATAEILKVIARSPSDTQPVFDAIAQSAKRLLGGFTGAVQLYEGDWMHLVALTPLEPVADAAARAAYPMRLPPADSPLAAWMREHGYRVITDMLAEENRPFSGSARARGFRSALIVQMRTAAGPIGAIVVTRKEAGDFAPRHIELIQTLADQAVIAIQNARQINETQRALERQTATSEILKVIAASPADTSPVFEAIAQSANRLLGGLSTAVWRFEGEVAHLAAFTPTSPEADAALKALSPLPVSDLSVFVLLKGGEIAQLADTEQAPERLRDLARLRGYRAMLFVPLVQQGRSLGFVSVTRRGPGGFAPDDVSLLKTFADQAVIAIQNARLFNETREALEQLQASADVLGAIGRSVSDAAPVFEEILSACQRLFGSHEMGVYTVDADEMVRVAAWRGETRAEVKTDVTPLADSITGRIIAERRTHHIPNLIEDPNLSPLVRERAERLGSASLLYAPMLREDRGLGSILIVRSPPRPFTARETEMLRTFADQAAIAIENARLFNETKEALERQTATSEILKVIASSPADTQPVFQAIADSAKRLLGGHSVMVARYVGGMSHLAAITPISPEADATLRASYPRPLQGNALYGAVKDGRPFIVSDVEEDDPQNLREQARARGWRSLIALPLLQQGSTIGAIAVTRAAPGLLPVEDIELLRTFADQAAIAIENARLFNETKEALERQTATSNVLKVISQSVSDAAPVFETILDSCQRLFGLEQVAVYLVEGDMVRGVAQKGWKSGDWGKDAMPLAGSSTGRAIAQRSAHHISDLADDPGLPEDKARKVREAGGLTVLYAPMLAEDRGLGSIVVSRQPAKPFTEKEIALVQSFADQAAIAIQNARLFNEVTAKTRDLEEALRQQTATSEVLKVISRSAFDLQAVFEALLSSAVQLSGASGGIISLREGESLRVRTMVGTGTQVSSDIVGRLLPSDGASAAGRVLSTGKIVAIPDVRADSEYAMPEGGARARLAVPMLRNDKIEGVISLVRDTPGHFEPRIVEVVQTFADQAVIAIENVRLFEQVQARTRELSESLKQQTATSEVLKVISRSAFDLQTVLDTLVSSARELCEADQGIIWLREGDVFHAQATIGFDASKKNFYALNPRRLSDKSLVPRVARSGRVEHIPDTWLDAEYEPIADQAASERPRTLLGVPLLHGDRVDGVMTVSRKRADAFLPRQIELTRTFADQAVIAIQNVRLFEQVQSRTRELAASLDDLRKTQDRLVQTEKLASLGQLTAGIAHEIKNPLNFVNNFSSLTSELTDELLEVLAPAPLDATLREEVDQLAHMIKDNLKKVVNHGKRADSIVKNMLLHSRTGASEHRRADINAIVEESLNLAYHGARAEKPGFNIALSRDLDPKAGMADVFPQEISRALLNLISNGFYAAAKRPEGGGDEPRLAVATRDLGDSVEIRVRDNGAGIPDDIKEKIFNPFFTTKPAGEGTGLGLSMTHDIVVKQHGGTLDVASATGEFTEFRIVLPRGGARTQDGVGH